MGVFSLDHDFQYLDYEMISTASDAQPLPYDTITVARYNDRQDPPNSTPILSQIIKFLLYSFLLYNLIRVILIVERG